MKIFLSARKKKAIISALAAGMCVSGLFMPQSAEAAEQFDIGWDGKTLFNIKYYGASDYTEERSGFFQRFANKGYSVLNYDLTSDIKSGLNKAFKWWAEILGPGANISQPAQYFVGTENEQNASAGAISVKNGDITYNPNLFTEIFQSGQTVPQFDDIDELIKNDEYYANKGFALGAVIIGQYLGTDILQDGGYGFVNAPYYASATPLILSQADITPIMFHEIGHSLGINAATHTISQMIGEKEYSINVFRDIDDKSFSAHLYDQYGTKATSNAVILSSKEDISSLNAILEANPALKEDIKPENILYVPDTAEAQRDGKIYLYFAGKNVTEALDGKTFTRGDGQQISGLPINLWEIEPDFSHIELARSMMSHQEYRSYANFMEAELAALQDMGYKIDRKNFYGRSIYNDGLTLTNYQGFSARENGKYVDGYNNSTFGIGLHVYGSNNNITQAGNIFANGAGAVGVRVDGINNTITIPKGTEIHADGSYNNGLLIAYGKNHNVNVEGTVTATGESGNALSFDFGSNVLGTNHEYRGSFFRYRRNNIGNFVYETKNLGLNEIYHPNDAWSFTDPQNSDLNAPMVNTVNISGKLVADPKNYGNAIYIDSTAFVDTININDGAEITGNIHSQWKHFSPQMGIYDYETPVGTGAQLVDGTEAKKDGLKLQYKGGQYVYTKYIPDLVTKLNFNNTMSYDGDIDGMDNMKINVNGNLVYGGTANVVSVNVAKNAGLFGGTFTVNDMSEKMAEGFSDDTTGKFYNHGTIGSAYSDKSMTINGDLVSDGTLSGYAGGELGDIVVNGTANVDGSTISATNALPDETMTVLKAGTVTGALANPDGKPYAATGMLSTTGTIEGNTVKVTAHSANNLEELTAEQAEAYDAMEAMQKKLVGDERGNEMRSLYSLSTSAAKSALTELGSSAAPQMTSLVQQSTVADRVISDRLSTAFAIKPVEVTLPVSNFADGGEEKGLNMNVELPVAQDNNAWVKFTKNWGDLRGGANYHGSAISGGYDRMLSENWRGGVFLSYQTMGLDARSGSGNIYDTRFGIYAGYHKDAADAYLYADYGHIRNKLHRGIGALGLGAEAKYNSNLVEIGGEYKYDLHARDGKIWHVSPYANLQLSWLNQKAYAESGAGIFNQHVAGKHNTYFAGQLGVELKRYLNHGSYGMRLGVKHAFAGADPELSFCYEGNDSRFYSLRNSQDKTHFIFALSGDTEFANGWFLNGEARLQKGAHDKDLLASVTLRKVW